MRPLVDAFVVAVSDFIEVIDKQVGGNVAADDAEQVSYNIPDKIRSPGFVAGDIVAVCQRFQPVALGIVPIKGIKAAGHNSQQDDDGWIHIISVISRHGVHIHGNGVKEIEGIDPTGHQAQQKVCNKIAAFDHYDPLLKKDLK